MERAVATLRAMANATSGYTEKNARTWNDMEVYAKLAAAILAHRSDLRLPRSPTLEVRGFA